MNTHVLVWDRYVGICTYGAGAMAFFLYVYAVVPDASWVHCSIHQEARAAKGIPVHLKHVLDTTGQMVNFVKARPLNSCLFAALCNAMGSKHETLLLHTEICWLTRGNLKYPLKVFFSNHLFEMPEHLHV